MKPAGVFAAIVLLSPGPLGTGVCLAQGAVGDGREFEITRTLESARRAIDNSSSSESTDRDSVLERMIATRDGGVEVEYDLPHEASAEERAAVWQFPARVFRPATGAAQLLNSGELEKRVDRWLQSAGMTREACGHWIFTWTAIQIDCDPQSVIKMVHSLSLPEGGLEAGAPYRDEAARAPGVLTRESSGLTGAVFTTSLEVDAEAIRKAKADSDVIVSEITGKPVTLAEAQRKRAGEQISGTISVRLETDVSGAVWRRTRVMRLETRAAGEPMEIETRTETLERRELR